MEETRSDLPTGPAATPVRVVAAMSLALSAVVALLVAAFAWPAVSTAPRDLPIGLVAPAAAAAQIGAALDGAQPGAFEVVGYPDDSAARVAIADREVYGALVVGPQGAQMLTAPGASPTVATLLEGVATALNAQRLAEQGIEVAQPVTTEPVVVGSADDPRGIGFPSLVFPVVIGSIALGSAVSLRVRGAGQTLLALLLASIGAGLAAAALAGPWLGVLPDGFWPQAAVLALAVLAGSAGMVGAHRVLGVLGLAVVGPVLLLLGNPLSAAATAPQLLPDGWSQLGQLLPPGALVQALRSVAFFGGAGAAGPLTVLAAWAVIGLLLVGVRRALDARR